MSRQRQFDPGPYVDGNWIETDDRFPVTDLADDTTLAAVGTASAEQARTAVGAASATSGALRETTVPERARWCEAIAAGIRDRAETLADTVVREAGKPITSARNEVESAAERFDRAAEEARTLTGEHRRGTTDGHAGWAATVAVEPVGTVLCISPYNYPLATPAMQVAPALAAGNAVALKPASQTPVAAAHLAAVIADCDLPAGAFNLVTGPSSTVGDALVGDRRVNAIAMTGSTAAGKRVADRSGLVRLVMELGGNAPAIVFPDADLEAAATDCARGGLKYAGQRCSAVSRVLVEESVHDELVEHVAAAMDRFPAGDLFDEETVVGPLIDEGQADWVEDLVRDARDRGADLVRGGARDGQFFEPTLLADVPPDARIVAEEQFGPVIPVVPVADRAAALAVANDTDYALDACVFTRDHERAMSVAERVDAGAVRINGAPSHGLGDIPYGGNRGSGVGREGLHTTIEAFVRTKSVVL